MDYLHCLKSPAVVMGTLGTAYGLVVILFGFRFYRLWAALIGIASGAILALELAARFLPDYPLLHYSAGLLCAAIGCALFYHVSVFLLGASLGVAVMHVLHMFWLMRQGLTDNFEIEYVLIFYVVTGAASGALATVLRRPFLVFITSAGGAACAVYGAGYAASGEDILKQDPVAQTVAGVALVVLGVVGVLVQRKTAEIPLAAFVSQNGEDDGKKSKSGKKKKAKDKDEDE
jgi:hypothetical protein